MSEWTKQRLDQMIADGVEENLSVDYKSAGALSKNDERKKTEITKDVSSFANSSGGVVIHPVTLSETDNTVCYVVEVSQSHTAHMARDHRYHKRHNFTTAQMEDYEVRDVMNRRTHPKIKASLFINRGAGRPKPEGVILVKLNNVGRVLARHVMAELEIPLDLNGLVSVEKPVIMEQDDDGDFYLVRLRPDFPGIPVFPGSDFTLSRRIHTNVRVEHTDNRPVNSRRYVRVSVFADEMAPIRAKLDIAPVILGWTAVENTPA